MALVISKKVRTVLFAVLGVLVLGGGGFLVWRVNQPDTVAPEDSEAADYSEKSEYCTTFEVGGIACEWINENELDGKGLGDDPLTNPLTTAGCYYKTTSRDDMYAVCSSYQRFVGGCGNGICDSSIETATNCSEDCGYQTKDGDCDVDKGENTTNSPEDCCNCDYANVGCYGKVNCPDATGCDSGDMCQMVNCNPSDSGDRTSCLNWYYNEGNSRYICVPDSTGVCTSSGTDDEDDTTPYIPPFGEDDTDTTDEDDTTTWWDPFGNDDDTTDDNTTTWSDNWGWDGTTNDWSDWGTDYTTWGDTDYSSFFGLWDHDTDYSSFFDWGDEEEEDSQTSTTKYTLIYRSGINGYIWGVPYQLVEAGADGSSVKALPYWGYEFSRWSDGSTNNPRTDTNINSDLTVTAEFVRKTTSTYEPGEGYVDSQGDVIVVTETGGTEVVYSDSGSMGIVPQTGVFDTVVGKLSLGLFFIFLGGIVSQYSRLNYFYNSLVEKREFRKEIKKQKRAKRIRDRLEDKFK